MEGSSVAAAAAATGAGTAVAVVASGGATADDSGGAVSGAGLNGVAGCVFCAPDSHPEPLFQTDRITVMPDLYPLVPGHVLVVSREHLPCMGAGDDGLLDELDGAVRRTSTFVEATYGIAPLMWENGVSGQTVFHAHVHLIPIAIDEMLEHLVEDSASVEVQGWAPVAERYRETGEYHVIHLRGRTWLVEGNGAMNWEGRRRLAMAAGASRATGKWLRTTRPADVAQLASRWDAWAAGEQQLSDGGEDRGRP